MAVRTHALEPDETDEGTMDASANEVTQLFSTIDRQYETYLELAELTRVPGVLDEDAPTATVGAPVGLTLINR